MTKSCRGFISPGQDGLKHGDPKEEAEEPLTVMGSGEGSARVRVSLGIKTQQDFWSGRSQRGLPLAERPRMWQGEPRGRRRELVVRGTAPWSWAYLDRVREELPEGSRKRGQKVISRGERVPAQPLPGSREKTAFQGLRVTRGQGPLVASPAYPQRPGA